MQLAEFVEDDGDEADKRFVPEEPDYIHDIQLMYTASKQTNSVAQLQDYIAEAQTINEESNYEHEDAINELIQHLEARIEDVQQNLCERRGGEYVDEECVARVVSTETPVQPLEQPLPQREA